jgi:hypothetical protein
MGDGAIVANDWTDLVSGNLRAGIDGTETIGNPPSSWICGYPTVWTGARPDGTVYQLNYSCSNWTTGSNYPSPGSMMGRTDVTGPAWSEACAVGGCGVMAPIYCFEQ